MLISLKKENYKYTRLKEHYATLQAVPPKSARPTLIKQQLWVIPCFWLHTEVIKTHVVVVETAPINQYLPHYENYVTL